MADDQPVLIDATPPARRRAGHHARATQRRLAYRATLKVVAALSLLVLAIVLLGFDWTTGVIELAVVFCMILIDRTAVGVVDR